MTYHTAVFLFHMTAIVLLIGTRPGKGNLLIATVVVEALVDKLVPTLSGSESTPRRGKGRHRRTRCTAERTRTCPLTPDWQAFRPAAGNVYRTERVQIKTFRAFTAMSHQVYFQKTRLVLLPISKGPDGYRPLKQAYRSGSGKSPSASQPAVWPQ